jgi:ABC-type antimicrobial peptide transport system permease subunit
VDPSIPVPAARPIREALGIYLLPQRLAAWVSGAMGLFGLLLAIVGVYGLMAFQVTRRSREMAVRMALGATPGNITRLLVVREARVPAIGMGVGVLLAAALTFGASRVVAGARAVDPVVLITVPLLLLSTSLVAMLAPVMPLLRRPPMERLRED